MLTLIAILSRIRRHHIAALLSAAAIAVAIGGALFSITQSVSIWTGFYWAVTTATTVGYGDVSPKDGMGRAIAVGVMITAIPLFGAAFASLAGMAALSHIRRLFGMERTLPPAPYVAIYGAHSSVAPVLEELIASGRSVVMVADVEPATIPAGIHLIVGDPTSEAVLASSHPERAEEALVVGEDGDVLVTCVALRSLAPNVTISALTRSPRTSQALRELGVSRSLSVDELVGHTLAKCLEAPHSGDLMLRLVDSDLYRIAEVPPDAAVVSRRLSEIRAESKEVVIGLVQDGEVTLGMEVDPVVRAEDRLLILAANAPARNGAGTGP